MAVEKRNSGYVVHKHDTEENWLKATSFTPEKGQLIIYDADDDHSAARLKVGNSDTNVNDLPVLSNIEAGKGVNSVQQTPEAASWPAGYDGNEYISQSADVVKNEDGSVVVGALGNFSTSLGGKSQAKGKRAVAEGTTTVALGGYSHSEGNGSFAAGVNSHAEGIGTTAMGENSHAEGSGTAALGNESHAEGIYSKSTGQASHAEGYDTEAQGRCAHTEGFNTKTTNGCAHAEGYVTQANGEASHAEGYETIANCTGSHTEGYKTKTDNSYAHAEGYETLANGEASHAEGIGTIASGKYQHVQGKYNVGDNDNKYAHIVGWGTSATDRKNIHTVDTFGNAWFNGGLTTTGDIRTTGGKVSGSILEANSIVGTNMINVDLYTSIHPTIPLNMFSITYSNGNRYFMPNGGNTYLGKQDTPWNNVYANSYKIVNSDGTVTDLTAGGTSSESDFLYTNYGIVGNNNCVSISVLDGAEYPYDIMALSYNKNEGARYVLPNGPSTYLGDSSTPWDNVYAYSYYKKDMETGAVSELATKADVNVACSSISTKSFYDTVKEAGYTGSEDEFNSAVLRLANKNVVADRIRTTSDFGPVLMLNNSDVQIYPCVGAGFNYKFGIDSFSPTSIGIANIGTADQYWNNMYAEHMYTIKDGNAVEVATKDDITSVQRAVSTKSNKLVAGNNITITPNDDGTETVAFYQSLDEKDWEKIDTIKIEDSSVKQIVSTLQAGKYKEIYIQGHYYYDRQDGKTTGNTGITIGNQKMNLSYFRFANAGSIDTKYYFWIKGEVIPSGSVLYSGASCVSTGAYAAQTQYTHGGFQMGTTGFIPAFSLYTYGADIYFGVGTEITVWGR